MTVAAKIKWTAEKIAEVEKLSFTMTRMQIAERMGVNYHTVRDLIYRLRIKGEWRGSGTGFQKYRGRFKGCDKDCERCPYPDCLIPDSEAAIGLDIDLYIRGGEQGEGES